MNQMYSLRKYTAPRRTIRFWQNWLVFACILPAVLITTFIIVRDFDHERDVLERDLIGTARALTQTVDAELIGARSALLILASSPYLESGDFEKFYDEAQKVIHAINAFNIVLTRTDGQQIINTLKPLGTPLPLHGNPEQLRRVIETEQPVISDLLISGVSNKPIISVEAPVLIGGKPRYGLAIGILAERFDEILRHQKMPTDWVTAIVDRSQTIVARTIGREFIGKKVSADLNRALTKAVEGAFEGVSREGISVLSGFSRSPFSGWTVSIGIPSVGLFKSIWQALWANVVAAIVLLLTGILLAGRISARIATSIRALRDPAMRLGLPGPIAVPPIDIQEVHELGQSFVTAHQLIEQRTTERDDLRRRIMSAQEEERLRLAHDLHDQTGQSVSAAILELKSIEPLVSEIGRDRVRFLRKQLDELSQVLHRIAWELRPASIDELGLTNALENYVGEWSKKHAIKAAFHCADADLDMRSNEIRTTIYRVIQEALTNIARHAGRVTHVSVVINTSSGVLYLTIEDNGRGFDPTALSSRLGLAGMRERLLLVGGQLEIESSPVTGTTIFARIPLLSERTAA